MDRRQISWLIVRAFGVYLLVQAFILLPELLAGLFTARYYSNVMSSLGSETASGGSRIPPGRLPILLFHMLTFAYTLSCP